MLTPQQKEAVYNRGGKLLVSAAAGSGKTKVLVDRLLSYLTDPVDPANLDEFLIITYTKAAASELRGKIAAKLSEKVAQEPGNRHLQQQLQRLYLTKISTVHAFCGDLLREFAYLLDVPADFRVADENECLEIQTQVLEQILDQAYESAELDPDFQAFVNTQGFGRDDRQIPEILLKVYNSARCHLDPERWLNWCLDSLDLANMTDASQTVWGQYLIEDLKAYLKLEIDAIGQCIKAADMAEGMEKPAVLLRSVREQLIHLYDAQTWDSIVSKMNVDFGRLVFPKKVTDLELAERIKAVRKACKETLAKKSRSFVSNSDQVFADLRTSAAATRGLVCLVRQFSEVYDKRKRMRRVMDFGDLEHKTLDLLIGKNRTGYTALARQIGSRFREIMVDEYQDSNAVQDSIFEALTREKQNCFMVGDVKQSIYQFRLADPGIFIEKYNAYAPAERAVPGEGRKILLSHNFRSSAGVIAGVNDVFSCCMTQEVGGIDYTDAEMLREGIPHIPLGCPEVEFYGIQVQEDTYAEEASFVAQKIRTLLDEGHMVRQGDTLRPVKAEDIVILLRSPGSVGGEFAYALEQKGIRCTTGGSIELLVTEEVMILRSLLQIISNPLQDIPLVAVLTSRVFGFTADDLAEIRGKRRRCSIYESLLASKHDKSVAFIKLLKTLRQEARLYTVSQLLQRIFLHTSMDSLFSAMPDGIDKVGNLHLFCQIAADFENSGRKDLGLFLDYLDIMDKKGLSFTGQQQNAGAVTIMSIHKSKGLEFPVVFLCGLSRGFNQESTKAQVLCHKALGLGLSCVDAYNRIRYPNIAKRAIAVKMQEESISEEIRVLYVAMTRPRDRLIMTYAEKNLQSDLEDIALRKDMTPKTLMMRYVDCPGSWVLQTAMGRTEAGEFFRLGGRPSGVSFRDPVWRIQVVEAVPSTGGIVQEKEVKEIPLAVLEKLRDSLNFAYPHILAVQTPSKQTATQLKGRFKDQEAAEDTPAPPIYHHFRRPSFAGEDDGGIQKGNAFHAVMQYIHYEACQDLTEIKGELQRLTEERRISPDQCALVDPEKILKLFSSPIGKRLCNGSNVLREFKFSILENGSQYCPGLLNEEVLLQGVVDCALLDDDGITVIDFKTDCVMEQNVSEVIARYTPQVSVYAQALQRIYQKKVKAKYLYLFALDRFEKIP